MIQTKFCRLFASNIAAIHHHLNMINWLVVSTHPKNISQIGSFPQVGVKIKMFETTT